MKLKNDAQSVAEFATWKAIAASQTPAELLSALYGHMVEHSKGTDPKSQAADKQYGTEKISLWFKRAVPTPNGIAEVTIQQAFNALMADFGYTKPSAQMQAWEEATEQLATEGFRFEYIPSKSGRRQPFFCGPNVPQRGESAGAAKVTAFSGTFAK